MKWIKLYEEFESLSQEMIDLTNKLKKYDIPVELWGTGKSKTIKHLLDELNGDECYLEESENKITRYIEFVGVKIYYTDENDVRWALKEDRQEFNDGRTRRRNMPSSVSEKMKFGEDPLVGAIRGIKEELGIDIKAHQLTKRRDLHYNGGSLSYPGLDTKYKGHQYNCQIEKEQFDSNGYIEIQKDKKTFFNWVKI